MISEVEVLNSCPGCNSLSITSLKLATKKEIFVTNGEGFEATTGLACCELCGLTFLNPKMSKEKLFEYYSKQSRIPRSEVIDGSPFDLQMQIQVDYIKHFIQKKETLKILEIGCAEGFFLKKFSENLTDCQTLLCGVELSEKYLEQAKKNLIKVTLHSTPIEKTNFGNTKFDVIVLRHVFEHLSEPMKILSMLRGLLEKDGVLYIEVPDSENIEFQLSEFYHHEHLLYFTPKVLENYFKTNGFEVLSCERFEKNPVGSGFDYPVIRSICKIGEFKKLKEYPKYAYEIFLANEFKKEDLYNKLLKPLIEKIKIQALQGKKLALFGAGPHTMDVLNILDDLKIDWVCVMDNNKNKHGKKIKNIPIFFPEEKLFQEIDCIVISSAAFEKEMAEQVKKISPKTDIITIYERS